MSTAMGVAYAGFGTGTIVVVPLAQRSIELVGWRDTYWLMGLCTLAALPLLLLLPWRKMLGAMPRPRVEAVPGAPRASFLREAVRTRPYWQIVVLFAFPSMHTFS